MVGSYIEAIKTFIAGENMTPFPPSFPPPLIHTHIRSSEALTSLTENRFFFSNFTLQKIIPLRKVKTHLRSICYTKARSQI